MSGHSKWAQIKRKKAITDNKKGTVFTRLGKNIVLAAKNGKDPAMNPSLRTAIDQARAANMPKENIEKAILKGTGELPGVQIEEVTYEGYGPRGIAFIVHCVTDNTNRTVNEIRNTFSKHGGSLGSTGSVLYMFEQKGVLRFTNEDLAGTSHDDVELLAIDADATDVQSEDEGMVVETSRENLHRMQQQFEEHGLKPSTVGVEWVTRNIITPSPEEAQKITTLIEALESHDDVNNVFTNADLP